MDYITTYTKLHFTPLDPKPQDIRIADIAHALSLMVRANGHFKHFYSVAQHCINCAHEAQALGHNKQIQLACLLHDASEAYISDITTPVKKNLPQYREIEKKLETVIHHAFGIQITSAISEIVKNIDSAMLWHEFVNLLGERLFEPEPNMQSQPDFAERKFSDVESEYLQMFAELSDRGECT